MTIQERVLAKMKTSYAKYGFKKEELTKLAEVLAKNLNEESTDEEVDNTLTSLEGYARMLQSVYNRGVTETAEKYKDYIPKPKEEPKPKETPTNVATPKEEKALTLDDVRKLVSEGIAEGLKPYKEREERERLQTVLANNTKLKGVPQKFLSRYHLEREEDADKVADEVVSDWTELKQGLVKDGTFVEAPRKSDATTENDDFRKMMEASSKRIQDTQKQASQKSSEK